MIHLAICSVASYKIWIADWWFKTICTFMLLYFAKSSCRMGSYALSYFSHLYLKSDELTNLTENAVLFYKSSQHTTAFRYIIFIRARNKKHTNISNYDHDSTLIINETIARGIPFIRNQIITLSREYEDMIYTTNSLEHNIV